MTVRTTFRLVGKSLRFTDPSLGQEERRTLDDADFSKLQEWAQSYRQLCEKHVAHAELLALGQEMGEWLDGGERWLERAFEEAGPPWIVEFAAPRRPVDDGKRFLGAPWELLALDNVHLAAREDVLFCPVRRYGEVGEPAAPSEYRLATVFMAASPRGSTVLSYEAEETAMLEATGSLGMDLVVEESGTLALLGERMAEVVEDAKKVDVLHLSCHGTIDRSGAEPAPRLILEDDVGGHDAVSASDLSGALKGNLPRLLFLSACLTGQAAEDAEGDVVDSLASAMLLRGVPAVLGWGSSVGDREATRFAAGLYGDLARHGVLEEAVARSRLALLEPDATGKPASDWHLARLYLSRDGGGVLSSGGARRVGRSREAIHKAFLDARQQVPVASPREFVGRRRQIQDVLRELRRTDAERPAGVLIHGLGRQGKSSLAARVAQRLSNYTLAVVFGEYDALAVLATVAEAVGTEGAVWRERWQSEVERQEGQLAVALRDLLENACRQNEAELSERPARKPLLLVVDDLEQVLDETKNPCLVQRQAFESIRAVIQAFGLADTESRLLFTSRFRFSLPYGGEDLAERLFDLPLPPMKGYESRKQALGKLLDSQSAELANRIDSIVEVAGGHAGLQDLLLTLGAEDPSACDQALEEIRGHLEGGGSPTQQKLVSFLEKLTLEKLIGVLSDNERELLRASQLFKMPVPRAVLQTLASALALADGQRAGARLVDLGLWEVHSNSNDSEDVFLARLARPHAGALSDEERSSLARLCVGDLFDAWGGANGGSDRSYAADHELTRLAMLAENAEVVAATAAEAVWGLHEQFLYQEAATLGLQAIKSLDDISAWVPPTLLRAAGYALASVGENVLAKAVIQRAIAHWKNDIGEAELDVSEFGDLLFQQASLLQQTGDLESAHENLKEILEILDESKFQRERAVTMGQIADIYFSRGELDEALRIRQDEELPVYEKLGDVRSRAVTMGKIVDIYTRRGELDEALRILKHDALPAFEKLGDIRGQARRMGQIADIYYRRGELDEALRIRQDEELPVYEKLGDVRERAVTMGKIADIYYRRGELDEALRIRQDEQLPVFEKLGDVRERAVTMGQIADIYTRRGELDEALRIRQDEQLPVFEKLGDVDSKANALWAIAKVDLARQDFQAAYERLVESYGINMNLGRLDGICFVGLDLGQLLAAAGKTDEARVVLERSRDGFTKLGMNDLAQQTQQLLDDLPPPKASDGDD